MVNSLDDPHTLVTGSNARVDTHSSLTLLLDDTHPAKLRHVEAILTITTVFSSTPRTLGACLKPMVLLSFADGPGLLLQ